MANLVELGLKHRTDKQKHSFAGFGYMTVYQKYFNPIRNDVYSVLELGVLNGSSLRVWRDYFHRAEGWGVDIDPRTKQDYGDRIHVVIGSQTDHWAIDQVAPGLNLDIVIDDGSHVVDHMVESFKLLWPRVASKGFYVIEDLETIYADISASTEKWPGQFYNAETTNYRNDAAKLDALFAPMIKALDQGLGDMLFLHRWHQ